MSKIIVYSKQQFEGKPSEFKSDVPNLKEKGFSDAIASIKVIGRPWVAYYENNFAGEQRVFEEGNYPILEDRGKFSSLKAISANLTDPEIELFELEKYGGRSKTLCKETNLEDIKDFSDKASSHKVRNGVWVLYERINRKGSQLIAYPGDVPSYDPSYFSDKASCVRPLLPKP